MDNKEKLTRVVITGANGFIGKPLVEKLAALPGYQVVAVLRRFDTTLPEKVEQHVVSNLRIYTNWQPILDNTDIVIHTAARAHILSDKELDPLAEFMKVNHDVTTQLAQACLDYKVKHFIFLSSIGVHGNESHTPFTVNDEPKPVEPYAISKLAAENSLKTMLTNQALKWTIIRPPLVYGPHAKGNVDLLVKYVAKRIPLPLGAINNKRSLVALDNLLSLIHCCMHHPNALNNTFLVCDGEDVSTTELIKVIAKAFKKPSLLLPIPASIISKVAILLGKEGMAKRLCSSLQVDMTHTQKTLNWQPVINLQAAIAKLVTEKQQSIKSPS